jgi:hypothetical protein
MHARGLGCTTGTVDTPCVLMSCRAMHGGTYVQSQLLMWLARPQAHAGSCALFASVLGLAEGTEHVQFRCWDRTNTDSQCADVQYCD